MYRLKFLYISLSLTLYLLTGCHAPLSSQSNLGDTGEKQAILLKGDEYQQTEDYTCGPAVVMSLLHHYDKLSDEQMSKKMEFQIAKEMGTTAQNGTSSEQMADWLKNKGFTVEVGEHGTLEILRRYLSQDIPVIVEWIDWGGHWVIVSRYEVVGDKPDASRDMLYLTDPAVAEGGITEINAEHFDSMWFDAQYFDPGHVVRGTYIIARPVTSKAEDA